jgi:hypothetical protein
MFNPFTGSHLSVPFPSMTFEERLNQADALLSDMQYRVFFQKLGQYGIHPANEKETADLLGLADAILVQCPRNSQQGMQTKQACMEVLGVPETMQDGCSKDVHDAVEYLCKQAHIVDAMKLVLAAQKI